MAPKSTKKAARPDAIVQVEKLMELMSKHRVAELEWENEEGRLVLRTQASGGAVVHAAPAVYAPAPIAAHATSPTAKAPAKEEAPKGKQITSPFVGTFYRAPSPTAEPYVREGQSVKRGDTLCIIEAMKLMNPLEAEVSGKIVSILVENGQPVEFGEPLFIVE